MLGYQSTVVVDLPTDKPHDFVVVSYTPAFINSWDAPDQLSFQVNYEPIFTSRRAEGTSMPFGNCVIDGWKGRFDTTYAAYRAVIPHTGKSITLSWLDTLDERPDNESWGLAGISVFTVSQDYLSNTFSKYKPTKTKSSGAQSALGGAPQFTVLHDLTEFSSW